MKKPFVTFITTLSFFVTLVFSVIVLNSTRITLKSSAQEIEQNQQLIDQACTMQVEVYVKEQLDDGSRVLLDFQKHPELDPLKWGFADTINLPPYSVPANIIQFTHPTQAKYTNFVNDLSFAAFPKQSQIYGSEEETDIKLTYQDASFDIIQQEINNCSLEGTTEWLCSSHEVSDIETISGIPVRCGMKLSFGWIVAKEGSSTITKTESKRNFSQTKPIETIISTDINGDGTTSLLDMSILIGTYGSHDPQSDINKDGRVNGLDYILIVEELRRQN